MTITHSTSAAVAPAAASTLRAARVGDLLPPRLVGRRARRIDATAFVLPGSEPIGPYLLALEAAADGLAAWDGRVAPLQPDGEPMHRLIIADRYGQVYAAIDAAEASDLPDAEALEAWFRFLATACPECGVLDDPIGRSWVP
jgi:hypothetical protein